MIVPLDHTICDVTIAKKALCVEFADGRTLCAPLEWFPMLSAARPAMLEEFDIAPDGLSISWPGLGETVSADFLLARRSAAGSDNRAEKML
ncbi:uncharacterized protein DUF2442 [Novosphingobium sp. PhB165]|uniref:DUF2442 domain-containing protein n=1 Tax=Novosphingobium sp. PhB165 TaxID=2485105 RepID=UPI0010E4676A|nr:DUF2442 domain-containing protein [Novosphingobium sp. PhB165]TCM21494.1 uncharacterized protein DUF2442 [Novosphingobium sp. PhB165]